MNERIASVFKLAKLNVEPFFRKLYEGAIWGQSHSTQRSLTRSDPMDRVLSPNVDRNARYNDVTI
jgi:hypothetical protein